MSNCLKAAPAANEAGTVLTPQQEKMKNCNANATAKLLRGDERKAFMSNCLKR
ncbi:Phosphate starvation-inducible protein PsiF precursor [compost metagenome]